MNITKISLKNIVPDENQPRRYFDEGRMGTLRESIKRHGIKSPLILEITPTGKYLIIDGERRFRAATELNLKEVPAILREAQNDVERLIEQFHLQEQHEGWSSTEKAMAVTKLAESMGTSAAEIGRLLGIPGTSISNYIAFGNIVDKANFQRSNVSLKNASRINSLKAVIKREFEKNDMEYNRTLERQLENAIYSRIRDGGFGNGEGGRFYTKLRDSVMKDPKSILEFIKDDSITVEKLFKDTNAKVMFALRNISSSGRFLGGNLKVFIESDRSIKIDKETMWAVKYAKEWIEKFLAEFDTL